MTLTPTGLQRFRTRYNQVCSSVDGIGDFLIKSEFDREAATQWVTATKKTFSLGSIESAIEVLQYPENALYLRKCLEGIEKDAIEGKFTHPGSCLPSPLELLADLEKNSERLEWQDRIRERLEAIIRPAVSLSQPLRQALYSWSTRIQESFGVSIRNRHSAISTLSSQITREDEVDFLCGCFRGLENKVTEQKAALEKEVATAHQLRSAPPRFLKPYEPTSLLQRMKQGSEGSLSNARHSLGHSGLISRRISHFYQVSTRGITQDGHLHLV